MKAPSTMTTAAGRSHQVSVRRVAPGMTSPRWLPSNPLAHDCSRNSMQSFFTASVIAETWRVRMEGAAGS